MYGSVQYECSSALMIALTLVFVQAVYMWIWMFCECWAPFRATAGVRRSTWPPTEIDLTLYPHATALRNYLSPVRHDTKDASQATLRISGAQPISPTCK